MTLTLPFLYQYSITHRLLYKCTRSGLLQNSFVIVLHIKPIARHVDLLYNYIIKVPNKKDGLTP